MKNNSICIAPWNHIFINTEGYFYHCCMAESYSSPIAHNGQTLHVSSINSFEDVLNSSDSFKLKQQMLNGEMPSSCQKCHLEEKVRKDTNHQTPLENVLSASKSYRKYLNKKYHKKLDQIISSKNTSVKLEDINFLDMRPGNTCNLKCRMCYPVSSKLWIDEWIKLFPDSLHDERIKDLKNITWGESPVFWNHVHSILSSIDTIHFAGGEPLFMKDVLYFLKNEQYAPFAKEINLTFNTNLTNITDEIINSWKKFKSVRLMISLDGTDKINDYIRYPSKFGQIIANIEKLKKVQHEINFQHCGIISTVQIYNIHNIVELIKFILNLNNPIIAKRIKFNLLSEPSCLSIQSLPAHLKDKYSQELYECATWLQENGNFELAEETKSIIKFMCLEDLSSNLRETKRRTEIIDRERHQKLEETFPLLWEYLETIEIN